MSRLDWGDYREYVHRGLRSTRVLLPVHYDPVAEEQAAWDSIPFGKTTPLPPSPPPIPPGTVSVPRIFAHRGRKVNQSEVHVLRLDTDQWVTALRATLGILERFQPFASAPPDMTVTDLHNDVEWAVRLVGDGGTWDRFAFAGRPVTPYTVHLPIDPARTRDAIAAMQERYEDAFPGLRGKLAGVR